MTQKWDSYVPFSFVMLFQPKRFMPRKTTFSTVVGYCYGTLKNKKVKASSVVSFVHFLKKQFEEMLLCAF